MKTQRNALLLCMLLLLLQHGMALAQNRAERLNFIERSLDELALIVPGLNQKVKLNVAGVSAQEFLRALAQANELNINIDPQLNFKIYNSFANETAKNVLLFLCKTYNMDLTYTGSIISVSKIPEPPVIIPVKEIKASYDVQKNTLSLELSNDSLVHVARKLTQISKKNVVVPTTLHGKLVSAFMSEAPFDTALEKIAFANELKLIRTTDHIYLFQALGADEELYVNSDRNTAVRRNFKPAGQAAAVTNFRLQRNAEGTRMLVSVDAANVGLADIIKHAAQEVQASYFLYTELKGSISMYVKDIPFNEFLNAVFQGTDYTFRLENGIYLIGDRKNEGLRAHKIIQLQNRSLDTIQSMIPAEWKKGVEIREFREQNTILLSGSSPQINEIEIFIRQLDKLVPMVLIEVTMIDIRKGKSIKTGITAGSADSIKTGGTVLPGLDYTFGARSINNFLSRIGKNNAINLGRVSPNFYVNLSALQTKSNVDIRSVPKLSTLNGHSALLSIGSKRYYSTTTQNVIPSLNPQTVVTQQFTAVDANLDINIRPIVSGDNQITLTIKVNISDFVGDPPLNAPPPTSTSKFESIVRARNEDMIVLGGIERTENADSGSGIPILSRIPLLKWLFSSRSKSTNKVITVVFIKPTIIY